MNKKLICTIAASLPTLWLAGQTLEMETQAFQPGNEAFSDAFGWSTKEAKNIPEDNKPTEPVEPTVDLDNPAVIDWTVAEHRGTAGVYDLKATDDFVITFDGFSGSDNFEGGHRFDNAQVFFGYTEGVNFNVPRDGGVAFATSFNGADDGEARLGLTIDVDDRNLFIYHWWNFGYGTFENLNVTLHSADGSELTSTSYEFNEAKANEIGLDLPAGQSYYSVNFTSIIEVQGTADGDYVVVENIGTNVGWRGTAVATERFDIEQPFEPGWVEDSRLSWIYQLSPDIAYSLTMGYLYDYESEWVYQYTHGFFYVPTDADIFDGAYLYGVDYGYVFVKVSNGGWFQFPPFGENDWANFFDAPAQ
jgi:hypothetical protein